MAKKKTRHLRQRQQQRSISNQKVNETLKNPDKKTQLYKGIHGGWVWKYQKEIKGIDITVIQEEKGKDTWTLTAY